MNPWLWDLEVKEILAADDAQAALAFLREMAQDPDHSLRARAQMPEKIKGLELDIERLEREVELEIEQREEVEERLEFDIRAQRRTYQGRIEALDAEACKLEDKLDEQGMQLSSLLELFSVVHEELEAKSKALTQMAAEAPALESSCPVDLETEYEALSAWAQELADRMAKIMALLKED